MIKTVLLDVDNTILDFDKCAEFSAKCVCRDFGLPYRDDIFTVFTCVNNSLWKKIELCTLTKEELHATRWNLIFDELNVDFDGVKFEDRFRLYLNKSAEKVDGADRLINYLSGKYFIGTASNGAHAQQVNRLALAGFSDKLDAYFSSSAIGYEKPAKEFFDYCFEHSNANSRDEVIIIGDSLSADIVGGIAGEIKTCWYNRKNQPLTGGIKPDYVITSLKEVEDFL